MLTNDKTYSKNQCEHQKLNDIMEGLNCSANIINVPG